MPKPIKLNVEVEVAEVGNVMRMLNRARGVVALAVDFNGDAKKPGPKGPRLNGGGTGIPRPKNPARGFHRVRLLKALADGKPHPLAELSKLFDTKAWRNTEYNARRDGCARRPTNQTLQITAEGREYLKAVDKAGAAK